MGKKSKQKRAGQHNCHQNKYQDRIGRTKPHRIENIRKIEASLEQQSEEKECPYSERLRKTAPQYRHLLSKKNEGPKRQPCVAISTAAVVNLATAADIAVTDSAVVDSAVVDSAVIHAAADTVTNPLPYAFPRRGDIWFANLGDRYDTSIQCGERPVLILSNDVGNRHSETVSVVPLTSKMKKLALCTHVLVGAEDCDRTGSKAWGRMKLSMALAEQVTTLSKKDLLFFFCRVTNENKLKSIGRAVDEHLGILPLP